jgi:ribosomal protein S18 acetylase RimI-like enzyme
MHIQTLTATDVSRYRALMLHAYEVAADGFTSTAAERGAEPESWWVRRIADPASLSTVWGAFDGDELVGAVNVEFASKSRLRHKAHIVGMFVLAHARGAGVGKQLLDAALAAARARLGVKVVTLTVTEGNVPAIRLYESCGFRPFGVEPMAIDTPSGFKSKVHMWLSLQSEDGAD